VQFRQFFIFILIIISYSCTKSGSSSDQITQLKELEYSRESNRTKWKTLFDKSPFDFKDDILVSISKTKNDSLIPFLKEIIQKESNEKLLNSAIFALGQTALPEAEGILLNFFKSTTSVNLKKEIIKALEQCGSKSSLPLLNDALNTNSLRSSSLQCAAILARKNIDIGLLKSTVLDSNWSSSGLKENAYFIYYSAEKTDLNLIVNNLSSTKGNSQKYYLKALTKVLGKKGNVSFLMSDSLLKSECKKSIIQILKGTGSWQNKIHALKSFTYMADSTDYVLIKNFTVSDNVNLKIEGFGTLSSVFPENSTTYLLNALKNENDYSVKGKIISLIAKNSPNTGYRLIQKNLDKGTISFKEDLLQALEFYNNDVAKNTLNGFLMVQEKRLVNLAFSILKKKNLLSLTQIESLMASNDYSVLYNALGWQKTKKRYVNSELLIEAFTRFNIPDYFEVQEMILEIIKNNKDKLDAGQLEELSLNTATESINNKFKEHFPNFKAAKRLWPELQQEYLSIDSVMATPSNNILVEILTSKGEIEVELYPGIAPMTVTNFLKLAEKGFYDKLIFHRVIPDFVIQGGDPSGNGWGGAGYTIPSEDYLTFERGTIGIATSGFDTGSCQFFICQSEQPHLRGNYTAFGKVVKGLDIVDNIQIDDFILSIKPISLN